MSEEHGLDNQSNTSQEECQLRDKSHGLTRGDLQGISNLPVEVFLEIGSCIRPGDLISLIRTNKLFRAVLLDRSAASVWRRSLGKVPNLPPCPTGMTEPQYAALIFSDNCTICGIQDATSTPDPYLQVRLCPACRSTQLVGWMPGYVGGRDSIPFTQHTKPANGSEPLYWLRTHGEADRRMRNEFIQNGDDEGLARWNRQRYAAWEIQSKEGERLLQYIYSAADSIPSELQYLKTERRERIHQQLKSLGWDEKYFNFWGRGGRTIKKWRNLVEVPEPLTEQIWMDILPKLARLLERNHQRLNENEQFQRLEKRRLKVDELLRAFQRDVDPYQSIGNALQQSPPESIDSIKTKPVLQAPFPGLNTLLSHFCLDRLYNVENTLERVEEIFKEQRDIISQKWLEWRTKTECQLIRQYRSTPPSKGTSSTLNTMLTIKGSTDATKDLPANTRFLLRADTVFIYQMCRPCDQEREPIGESIHFPFISALHQYPYFWEVRGVYDPGVDGRYIQCYFRYIRKEVIVKALLKELGMPDAAHIELEYMGKVFICGRCTCREAMRWDEIVDHYHANNRNWLRGRFTHNSFKTRHPVVFQNLHDLGPGASAQPLVHLGADTCMPFNPVACCLVCHWIERFEFCGFDSMETMNDHMLKMHDSAEPMEGLHFMNEWHPCKRSIEKRVDMLDKVDWEKKWDEYHDAQSALKGKTEA